jgi:hypothetical protein
MAFQTPITIKAALDAIQRHDYVLPAIQREFVWNPHQVCRLFDSLMQGYPIGSFLFWRIEADHSRDYTWYGVIKDYHQKNKRHCPVLDLPAKPLVAILDGQQRLTALNIGLRGSHAEKEPRKHWSSPHAFLTKRLYLNLCSPAEDNEQRLQYDFRFLTPERATALRDDNNHWFLVADIFESADTYHVIETLQDLGLGNNKAAGRVLARLQHLVHAEPVIPHFEEKQQDLDKVLNIFIRVNSGGTVLSYSDLLLSIATASWKGVDARAAIHGLVDELNGVRGGFGFSKDIVLKAGLMLADIPSVAFRVTNFNAKNMETLHTTWTAMSKTLRLAVELLADFGFSGQTLAADSILIPLAYYLHHRGLGDNYRDAVAHAGDRNAIRGWVLRTLVKSGVWGSGLDTVLLAIRAALQEHGASGFPVAEVEAAMAKRGKFLRFTDDEIQDLLDSSYGDKRTLALLSLLYPHCDLRNVFHLDHVFPKSQFTPTRLRKAGVPENRVEEYHDKSNRLANLQLLEGPVNTSKLAKLPADWLVERFPVEAERTNYRTLHDLGDVHDDLPGFGEFSAARRERLAAKLKKLLVVAGDAGENGED